MAIAKVRINPLTSREYDVSFEEGDTFLDILEAIRKDARFTRTEDFDDHWTIFVDGYAINKKYWSYARPKSTANVLVAIVPRGGELAQAFKQVVIVFSGHIGAAIMGPIGGVLGFKFIPKLINKLIPPPGFGQGISGWSANKYDSAQTYSISNQSNAKKAYGPVPRLYGRHRMFPLIAGDPYTDIEADPNTGELVQYFYAIYDFGFGPHVIEDLKIGDTLIEEYTDVETRLVDLNKVQEGYWDDPVFETFELYKGDVAQTSVSVALNKNQNDAGAVPAEYQAVRTASTNVANNKQEIVVTFAFPKGLTTFDTAGTRSSRTVDLRLEFSEDAVEDWHDFDDFAWVDDFDEAVNEFDNIYMPPDSWDDSPADSVALISSEFYNPWDNSKGAPDVFMGYGVDGEGNQTRNEDFTFEIEYYGVVSGTTARIPLVSTLPIGSAIYVSGTKLGVITGVTTVNPTYHWIEFPVANFSKTLFYRIKRTDQTGPTVTYYMPDFNTMLGTGESVFKAKGSDGGINSYTGNQQNLLYGTFRFKPKTTETVKVRLTRIRSYGGASFQIFDDLTWDTLTTRFDRDPILTPERHTFLEMRIKATDQINGAIQNLSAVTTSVLDVWNGAAWVKEPTANPAWIYADLITGRVNKSRLDKTRLDTDSLLDWANFCDEVPDTPPNLAFYDQPRFKTNFILDYKAVLSDIINQVTGAGQASLNMVDGKYGVLIDREVTTPVQVFTTRNSSNFSSTREYTEIPNALKVKYVDEGANWEVRERVVYDDGFDVVTAETFEEIETFGVTNEEQSFRFGRYMLAQAKLRQENINITVDFEHLVCTRGDYVLITQDAMRAGGVPARVKAVDGIEITIDTGFTTEPATNYGYTFRGVSGIETSTMTITGSDTADVDGTVPSVGDLIVWGEVGLITFECIVKSITPNDDLTAVVGLVEKNNDIFLAESSENIPAYSPQLSSVQDENLSPPAEVQNLTVVDNSYDCFNGGYLYFIDLSWGIPQGTTFEVFEIYVDFGKGFELVDFSNQLSYRYIVEEVNLGLNHDFKVIAVSSTGSKLALGDVTAVSATPLIKTVSPSDVEDLYINITNETLTLDWPLVEDCDIDRYLIRFSPSLTATWESSIPLVEVEANSSSITTQGRTGAYFIKALDWNGNQSADAASAITSIPDLFNLNIIEETNDFPTFPGTLDKTVIFDSALILGDAVSGPPGVQQYYPEGEYFYSEFLDLGEIYSVRLQSLIEAEGYTTGDVMANWPDLTSITALSTVNVSEWNVETYYRGRDSAFAMSAWPDLVSIDPISEGEQGEWTDWRKFTVGDFTARIFQFKLNLISNKPSVTPRVFDARIKSDMPDRLESFNDIVIPNTGSTITYVPAFAGPGTTPNVQVTQDDASQGDYYVLSNKTLASFDIIFYDKNDIAVQRQADFAIKGYGRKTTATI